MYNFIKNSLLLMSFIFCLNVNAEDNTQLLKDYVKQLMTDSMGMLENQNMSLDEKVAKAKTSLLANMDFDSMSKRSLGRGNYNKMTDEEFLQYKEAYKEYLVNAYSKTVNSYNNQIMNIKSVSQTAPNQYLVKTEIVDSKNGRSFSVDFYVKSTQEASGEIFKVLDILTEGISLVQTQQTQFNSIIESSNVDGLIKMLQSKS